jgi:C4-dicarboxylate-specific signal transduction histidine kinase
MNAITRRGHDAQTTTVDPHCHHLPLWPYRDWRKGTTLALAMLKLDSSRRHLRTLLSYAVAVIAVGIAVVATLALGTTVTHTPTLFFCSVMLSSWFGGVGPGILAGLLSGFALDYYFIPPLHALGIRLEEAPDMIVFLASAWFISWLSGEQRRAKNSLRQARDELDAKVQQRTAELKQTNEQLQAEIAERKITQEALMRAQAEVARVARVMTLGELAASIAHELNQPLAGVVLNGNACLRWLATQPPNLKEARQAIERAIRDAMRASGVLARVRGLLKKGQPVKERVDLHGLLQEVLTLVQGELRRHRVSVQSEFVEGLPGVMADRVGLQQVLLSLLMNAIESMSAVADRARLLQLRTGQPRPGVVEVVVQDSGVGLKSGHLTQIFESFYTTKPEGLGMGLAISRSIVDAHGGRLSAEANEGPGATFRFTLPVEEDVRR